ncbi:MAG: hypothetical protein JNL53_03195 [Cyclobacteriaceae bacterium]|nr:hypothetical protein [Cyclobacteriaceae bacterium]
MKLNFAILLFLLLTNCKVPTAKTPLPLAGKTIEYRYGESVYHVTFDSDTTLLWEAIAGDETGAKENETYVAEWIDQDKLFITWGEANGIGVSQVLDFSAGEVYNHLLRGRAASLGNGKIRILE